MQKKKIIIAILTFLIATFALAYTSLPSGNLELHFLDVGQGDATLIKTPTGKTVLIDGGINRALLPNLANYLGYFTTQIDTIILTHPDRDHLEGLIETLDRYEIKNIFLPTIYAQSPYHQALLEKANQENTNIIFGSSDTDFSFGDNVTFDFLYPLDDYFLEKEDTNQQSFIIQITHGKNKFLLTGDADFDSEKQILKSAQNLKSNLLKVGHHGSKNSTSETFLSAVDPDYAIISCGADNTYGHPAPEVLQKLEKYNVAPLRTDQLGTITFYSDGENLWQK